MEGVEYKLLAVNLKKPCSKSDMPRNLTIILSVKVAAAQHKSSESGITATRLPRHSLEP
jgi:hypothetical protein